MKLQVIKIGGAALADPSWLRRFAAQASTGERRIIVHGGGAEVSALSQQLGVEVQWSGGRRVTSEAALDVASMVLTGRINKRIVRSLCAAGVDAVGLSGEDAGVIEARVAQGGALGRVGEVTSVRGALLLRLLADGLVPVISPISVGADFEPLNVNADEVATAVAQAVNADELLFLTDVAAVRDQHGERSQLDAEEAQQLVNNQIASGGMSVKLGAAIAALGAGVTRVRVGSLEMLNNAEAGTLIRSTNGRGRSMSVTTEKNLAAALLPVYRSLEPVIVGGQGCYLRTEDGRELLDLSSGIGVNAFGYGDAQLAIAITAALQSGLIHTSNLYKTVPAQKLAERLVELSFADRVFFCNSGGEANEGAMKFARRYARAHGGDAKHEIVSLKGSFHGRLFGTLAVTDRPSFRAPFEPVMPGARLVAVDDLEELNAAVSAERTAAIIAEPVQGEGGVLPVSSRYLKALRVAADRANAVLIFDEVQVGLGRSGKLFAYQHSGVEPDILTLAKPLAGGLPMGAILLRDSVASAIKPGDHATTFGGGPFVSSVALSVVNRIADPVFLKQVVDQGEYLARLLGRLLGHPNVKQVRGVGLMWGIELETEAAPVQARALERGVLVLQAGEKVIRLLPPLTISAAQLEQGIDVLLEALA